MNIAIDVLAILGIGSKNRGIGNYSTSQLKHLFKLDKENKYFLLNLYDDSNLKELLEYSENVKEFYYYVGNNGLLEKTAAHQKLVGNIVRNFIKEHSIDVFYLTSPFDGTVLYENEWLEGTKTVATVYDIIPYLFKEKYLTDKIFYKEYVGCLDNLRSIDKLLAISNSAKDDLVTQANFSRGNIEVIYAGVDDCFSVIDISIDDEEKIKKKYEIQKKFIMCTGGDDDRKNIGELIIAFSKMPKRLLDEYQLVVACKLSQPSEERYRLLAKKHNIGDRLILTNFIPLDDLIILYNLAHIVAFPSKYEGFGLPVVEAMACGTPVLTSNNSSLGEIAENAAILVNPFDTEDITRGLLEILEKTNLTQLVELGYERIKMFNWDKVALDTLNSFISLNNSIPDKQFDFVQERIAFFSPLPPLQSGISDYSVELINELSNHFYIDIYIDGDYTSNVDFKNNISVYSHNHFKKNKDNYIDIIYQMGNSEYHFYMLDYIKKYPGTVVLHDYNLHGLMYHQMSVKNNVSIYKQYLYEDYDKGFVNNYVNDILSGKTIAKEFELPSNGLVTNYAKKIIVHSDYSKRKLLEENISRDVTKILHYAPGREQLNDKNECRKLLNMPEDKFILSTFGHIHETKRIIPILKAFQMLTQQNDDVILYLVGKPSPSIENVVSQFVVEGKLEDKVKITGYIDLNLFETYIGATDICLNLRFPYNGETSGSLMRILSTGKCVLVNDLGSFSEIPDNCCVKLESPEKMPEKHEVKMIYHKLQELISNPSMLRDIATNALEYAKSNLGIKDISKQYEEVINREPKLNLTEEILGELIKSMQRNRNATIEELYNLSLSLAYSK